jgi:hypothetical protein
MKSSNEPNAMNPEDFEKQLKQRPLRQTPAEWRAEILGAANEAAAKNAVPVDSRVSLWTIFKGWIASGLELKPKALAGLAAIWILIFALHFSTHDDSNFAVSRKPDSKQVMAEVREQRLFFAELAGLKEPRDVEPPKRSLPQPHSERREQIVTV